MLPSVWSVPLFALPFPSVLVPFWTVLASCGEDQSGQHSLQGDCLPPIGHWQWCPFRLFASGRTLQTSLFSGGGVVCAATKLR